MLAKTIKISTVVLCLVALLIPLSATNAAGEVPPFAGAPACMDMNHDGHADVTDSVDYGKFPDNELYHDLWNEKDGCHYDHEHGDSPYLANKYFGAPGALWGGQTVAYPFVSGASENTVKHNGYMWLVRTPEYHPYPGCGQHDNTDIGPSNFCVKAVRAQIHLHVAMDMFTRYHSGYVEVYACRPPYRDPEDCGVFKMGSSLVDWGQTRAPFYKVFRPRPFPGYNQPTFSVDFGDGIGNGLVMTGLLTDSINFPDLPGNSGEPYINVQPESPENLAFFRSIIPAPGQQIFTEFWSSNDYDCEPRPPGDPCHNPYFHLAVTIMDSWFLLDTQDMRDVDFICQPGLPCHYNGSLRGLNETGIHVLPEWDSKDGVNDGFVTWSGYTDRFGNPREGCTQAGSDCVPFQMSHAPVGVGQVTSAQPCDCDVFEYDIHFNSQPSGWIQFHGSASHSPAPTNTPPTQPPTQPQPSGPYVSTKVDPASVEIGGSSLVTVSLNNVPADGFKSAEFTCTYDAGLVEKSNIAATNLFGAEPVVAIHELQNGSFIVAIAGTNSNKAVTSGAAFTFNAKGSQTGQSEIKCTARVSKGDNVPLDLPATGASLSVPGVVPTSIPTEVPTSTPLPISALSGQVVASKPVTLSLFDVNNVQIASIVADIDGKFMMTPPAGNYTLVASASGFLSHQGSVVVVEGNSIALPPTSLLAGDVDGNGVIDQFDALTIGMSYTSSTPAAADLNNDGVIDFLDLELLAENYRMSGPSNWD